MIKSKFALLVILANVIVIFHSACVTANEFERVQSEKRNLQVKVDECEKVKQQYYQLQKSHTELEETLKDRTAQLEEAQLKYNRIQKARKDLQEVNDKILAQNQQLLAASSNEKKELAEDLTRERNELRKTKKELIQLQEKVKEKEEKAEKLLEKLQDREEELQKVSTQLSRMNQAMSQTLTSVRQALIDFDTTELTVQKKEGRVYVSLSQELLFAKGSSEIGIRGKDALAQLSEVLKEMKDVTLSIEGHTDSDGSIGRNWELSTDRATAVVLFLQQKGVDPTQMIASGRALYAPVAPNNSPENKAQNRRTEIIINPDLQAMYQLLQDSSKY